MGKIVKLLLILAGYIVGFVAGTAFMSYNCSAAVKEAIKGADAEIKHQLFLNNALIDKVNEQHRRIIRLENELSVDIRSCDDNSCRRKK